jgi:hypothetical protein
MQDDAVEIESNMIASGKTKIKTETGVREYRKPKEQVGPSGSSKNIQDSKIEEMSKIIKDLSNKLARMEVERRRPEGDRNPNQFRRQFNNPPQFLKRENRNNEQVHSSTFKK